MKSLLIVSEETDTLVSSIYYLEKEGYQIFRAETSEKVLAVLDYNKIDLILMDCPRENLCDLEILKIITKNQKYTQLPVIVLSDKGDELSKVKGFEAGADDYMVKPFSNQELIARMKAILRRKGNYPVIQLKLEDTIVADYLIIDKTRRTATKYGELIHLSYLEFELLYLFVRYKGLVLTRDEIIEQLWGKDYPSETRTIDVHISKLRKKIQSNQGPTLNIIPVIGIGYKMVLK